MYINYYNVIIYIMTNILLYTPPPYKISGGLCNFKLFFDICKKLKYTIYFCPLFKHVPSLNFLSPFHNRSIDSLQDLELINYYLHSPQESEIININDIVTSSILKKRNNVVIYAEDVMGNPAEQHYVVRWLHFFPVPNAVLTYNFETDYICFYSDYIYNFYKHVCNACGISDILTDRIISVNICRVFKFEPEQYESIKNRKVNICKINNRKCFTLRKLFPPESFAKIKRSVNINYAKDIMNYHQYEIKNSIEHLKFYTKYIQRKKIIDNIIFLKKNPPNLYSTNVIKEYLNKVFTKKGFEMVENRKNSKEFVDFFLTKDYFLSFDPFTFMNIIASLCGCISVVKRISVISEEEWLNGDPFLKFGIAYGEQCIDHALKTQHLLLSHITNMYYQNEENVQNLCINIENKFKIQLNKY